MTQLQDIISKKQSTAAELQRELGLQLRRERIRQRLEQQEVAANAGVARSAVGRVENGGGGTVHTLVSIVRALGREDWLNALAPQVSVMPMDSITRARKAPLRVRRSAADKWLGSHDLSHLPWIKGAAVAKSRCSPESV